MPVGFVCDVTGLALGPRTKSETGMTLQLLRPLRTLEPKQRLDAPLKPIGLISNPLRGPIYSSLVEKRCPELKPGGQKFGSSLRIGEK